ncbi:hypothetical protein RJ55_06736 [Drechmeria coniospora]|nr:hypothetical protein RJ55_06736 [Drechmeria coniospora]
MLAPTTYLGEIFLSIVPSDHSLSRLLNRARNSTSVSSTSYRDTRVFASPPHFVSGSPGFAGRIRKSDKASNPVPYAFLVYFSKS